MRGGRTAAAIIAVTATAGVVIQFFATSAAKGGAGPALFDMSRYFTIWTNVAVAVIYAGLALGVERLSSPRLIGGVTLSIMLVGVVFFFMLRHLLHLSGNALIANQLMHYVTPVLAPLHWLVWAPKGRLSGVDPLLWSLFPFAYLPYALARGLLGDKYAYPFIDPTKHGWSAVVVSVVVISTGFMIVGWLLVRIDRAMAR